MNQTFFRVPFATEGDKQEIPVPVDPSGTVTFAKGYGPDYERDQTTDPLAKPIEREGMNWLFGALTEAVRQYQTFGVPEFITAADNGGTAFPYEAGATVKFRANDLDPWLVFESLINNNTQTPGAGSQWRLRGAAATDAAPGQIQIATEAQAQALANDTNALTPKKLADAFKGSNQSLGLSGFQKHPGGLIEQWGAATAPGNSNAIVNIAFPITFPTRALQISVLAGFQTQLSTDPPRSAWRNTDGTGAGLTASGASISTNSTTSASLFWRALGY